MVFAGLATASIAVLPGPSGCGGGGGGEPSGRGGVTGAGGSGAGMGGGGGQGGNAGAGPGTGGVGGGGGTTGTAPGAFALTSPLHGSTAQPLTPMLQWNASDGATSYHVEIATAPSFAAANVVDRSVNAPATVLSVAASTLTAGVVYSWRVTAVNAAGATTIATGAPRRFSSPYLVPGANGIAVTPDGTKLVVASDVNNGPIEVITLASHAVTASISTGVASQPMGIAVSPDGTQALATLLTNGNGGVNGIAVIDLRTNTLTRNIADPCVGTTLGDIAYLPGGSQAAIPDLSSGCSAMGLSMFSPASASTFSFVNFLDTNDPMGVAISPNGAFALVTMLLDRKVYKVTFPSTVTPITVPSTSAGVAITPDGATAVVAGTDLDVITLSSGGVTTIPLLNSDSPGGDFHNVAVTPDGTKAVVVGAATIQIVALASQSVVASYPATGGTNLAISADGNTAFISDRGDGWVRVLQIP